MAVATTDGFAPKPPSPISATTWRPGWATFTPSAAAGPNPIVASPLGVMNVPGTVIGNCCPTPFLFQPTSVTMYPSSGTALRRSLRIRSGRSGYWSTTFAAQPSSLRTPAARVRCARAGCHGRHTFVPARRRPDPRAPPSRRQPPPARSGSCGRSPRDRRRCASGGVGGISNVKRGSHELEFASARRVPTARMRSAARHVSFEIGVPQKPVCPSSRG